MRVISQWWEICVLQLVIKDKKDLGLQRSLMAQPTSGDVKLNWCRARGEQAGRVLRTDTNWEVVSKFGFVALAAGSRSRRRAQGKEYKTSTTWCRGEWQGRNSTPELMGALWSVQRHCQALPRRWLVPGTHGWTLWRKDAVSESCNTQVASPRVTQNISSYSQVQRCPKAQVWVTAN